MSARHCWNDYSLLMNSKTGISIIILFVIMCGICCTVSCINMSKSDGLSADDIDMAISNPDSAYSILERAVANRQADRVYRSKLAMLRIIRDFHTGKTQDNDSIMQEISECFHNSRDKRMKALSLLCIGLAYSGLDEDAKAVRAFTYAESVGGEMNSYNMKYLMYKQWGWVLRSESPYSEAIDKFNKAYACAVELRDVNKQINVADLKGWEFMYAGKYRKAFSTFASVITKAQHHRYQRIDQIYKSVASAYEMLGEHEKALHNIDCAINSCKNQNDAKTLFSIKGVILVNLQKYDSARVYIKKGRQNKEYYQRASYLYDMGELENALGNYQEALKYQVQYASTLDSMYRYEHDQELIKVQKLYKYSLLSAERNKLALENQRKTNFIIFMILASVTVLIAVWLFYRMWRKKIDKAIKMKENLLEKSLSEIKAHSYALMVTRQEAQEQEMELMRKLNSKDVQLNNLQRQQHELKVKIFQMNDAVRKIENLKKMKDGKKISQAEKIILSDTERTSLMESANLCYGFFIDRLKKNFHDLTDDDLCLCCLLKLQISTQDQCLLLGINDSTLRKRKYRLKNTKMMLAGKFTSLDDFIATF